MSSKYNTKSFPMEPSIFRKFHQENAYLVYTVLMFLVTLALYFGTKNLKGFTAPEEVDLGSESNHRRRRKHHNHRHRHYDDDDNYY